MAKRAASSAKPMFTRSPTPPTAADHGKEKKTVTDPNTGGSTAPSHTLRGVRMSPTISTLAKAVVAYQREQPVSIVKDTAGYGYDYLSLGGLLEVLQPELAKHKLAILQFPVSDGRSLGVVSVLIHECGEFIEAEFVMPLPALTAANVTQMAGAAITYARRYALTAICRVSADADTDGT